MTYVFVETGQCGNQLGFSILDSLFDQLTKNFSEESLDVFFRESRSRRRLYARAVCLDTEPKVVNDCVQRANLTGKWQFDNKSVAYRHGGAGNNWVRI